MGLTEFQSAICRLLAARRRRSGDSYVAGGLALNQWLAAPRMSHDIDLFHDSDEALAASWAADRQTLLDHGFTIRILREAQTFVEALVSRAASEVVMQWVRDSAFRFFPLIEHDLFGMVLHPFDLATNKVLAMAGRLEPRDWIDVIHCDAGVQSLGLLTWAACGKDPGYNPQSLLAAAGRSRYSQVELNALAFDGAPPSAGELGGRWRTMLKIAAIECGILPASELGKCVTNDGNELFKGSADDLQQAVNQGRLRFHEGRIGGAWPSFKPAS